MLDIAQCGPDKLFVEEVDLLDIKALMKIFEKYAKQYKPPFSSCIQLAGLKAVGESVSLPLHYYHNNVTGTLNLLRALEKYKCYNIVFSSSACVYGDPETVPIDEKATLQPENPYGETKLIIERILSSLYKCNSNWNIIALRYFNPIGAHPSGKIGEDPKGQPNNLLPYVSQVAVGKRPKLYIFGNDYPTQDGTGVRDYIHVVDLAQGHLAAVKKVVQNNSGYNVYNLGTGKGISVLEVVNAFETASGKEIKYEIVDRRPGDSATVYADATKAKNELGWEAKLGVEDMCRDAWMWQKSNPNGYSDTSDDDIERKGKVFKLYD